jgi:DNA repair protein RadC
MKHRPTIREWSPDDRPREKLLSQGEQSLSTTELLAILLRTGCKGTSAIDLSRQVLTRFGSLRNMSHTNARDWKAFKGLGAAKTAQIKAALELGRRFREEELREDRPQIKSSRDAVDILMPQMRDLKKEVFKVVFLNSQNRIIAIEDLAQGTVNHASPIIREVFHRALEHFAVAIICAHNHPSGEVKPSAEDRQFTRKLTDAGQMLGVKVLDHLIIGENRHYSFNEEGGSAMGP